MFKVIMSCCPVREVVWIIEGTALFACKGKKKMDFVHKALHCQRPRNGGVACITCTKG